MACLLGIDIGTSSLKVQIIKETGIVIAESSRKYKFNIPLNGYAEQDPYVWWRACCEAIRESIQRAGIRPENINAVGLSGQMHGTVVLDKNQNVIRPVIIHCDARSSKQCKDIETTLGKERLKNLVMNPVFSGFMLPTLLWIRENEPWNYEKIKYLLLPKDFIRLKLTGNMASEYSDASATLLFDITGGKWSQQLLNIFKIEENILPAVFGSTELAGSVTRKASEETGLALDTPVVYGGGDQIMQAIGNGVITDGSATVNIGSSSQVCFPSSVTKVNPEVNSNLFCGYRQNHWIAMAASMSAGLSLTWFTSMFNNIDLAVLNEEILNIKPGSGGVIFLPYLGGERSPHLNPDLSGSFMGITHGTTRYHLARAIMEGTTFALNDCMNICLKMGLKADLLVASGGGAKSEPWLHMLADVFKVPLRMAINKEQASLGAAIVAGVGCGVFGSVEEGCRAAVQYEERIIVPKPSNHEIYLNYYQLFKEAFQGQVTVIEKLTKMGRQ